MDFLDDTQEIAGTFPGVDDNLADFNFNFTSGSFDDDFSDFNSTFSSDLTTAQIDNSSEFVLYNEFVLAANSPSVFDTDIGLFSRNVANESPSSPWLETGFEQGNLDITGTEPKNSIGGGGYNFFINRNPEIDNTIEPNLPESPTLVIRGELPVPDLGDMNQLGNLPENININDKGENPSSPGLSVDETWRNSILENLFLQVSSTDKPKFTGFIW